MMSFLRGKWGIAFGSLIGLIVGSGAIMKVTVSLFMKPITEDMGWTRGGFSAALFFSSFMAVIMQPIFGWLVDTYGVKRATLPLILLLNAAFIALSMMTGPIYIFYFIFLFLGIASCAQAPPMYSKVVSMWFDRQRGLALAVATTGAAIGTMLVPLYTQHLIGEYGWRHAYVGLALANLAIAFPVVALILREPPGYVLGRAAQQASGAVLPPGVEFREALRDRRFWALAAVFLLLSAGLNGTLVHSIAMLTDRGWTAAGAVALFSLSGFANIAGRFVSGWILDRSAGPAGPSMLILSGSLGCILFATGWGGMVPFLALLLLSFCYGADIDIMAYFASRYFGVRRFGLIYGAAFSAFAVGGGAGPMLMGRTFDQVGSYAPALILNAAFIVAAYLLSIRLGPYVFTPDDDREATH